MSASDTRAGFGVRLATAFKRLVIFAIIVSLAGVTAVLLSQLNARTFVLEVQDGKLVVLKGRLLPFGADPWRPADPALADAYAPLDLKGMHPYGVLDVKYHERDELDRALYGIIEGLARPRISSTDAQELEAGLYYLRRADRLHGLTDEQQISLKQMKADVAFYSARTKLEDAQRLIAEAMAQLTFATQAPNKHQREANQMLLAIQPESKALEAALRKAVHLLSAPAEPDAAQAQPAAPVVAPTMPPGADQLAPPPKAP